MGHKVTLYAAAGSKCPPNGILHYIPEQYNAQGQQYVSADPMRILYRRDILSSDFIIDASHTKTTMEEIAYFHREAKYKTIGILNGMVSHTPMCPRYNIVVGSQKWKELLEAGFTQFAGTPWEAQYGKYLYPMPKGAIIDVIPWATNSDFYTPGDGKKENSPYFLWFSRPTGYKGLGRAINIARNTKIHLKLAMPMELSEHKYYGEEYLKQIADANANGAQIEFVKLPNNSQHHEAKRELYRRARALLFTIESEEPFGLCVHPNTKIITNTEVKAISEVSLDDSVIGHDGKFHIVKGKVAIDYQGQLMEITSYGGIPTLVTPEHPCFVMKRHSTQFLNTAQWTRADTIKKGDVLVSPILAEPEIDIKYLSTIKDNTLIYNSMAIPFSINQYNTSHKILNAHPILPEIELSPDLMRLFGYYLAEGWTGERGVLSFAFHEKEDKYLADVSKLILNIFGLKTTIRHRKGTKAVEIYTCSAIVAHLFGLLLGKGAHNKHVPSSFLTLPSPKQAQLLKGMWRGDGSIDKYKGKVMGLTYDTVSPTLINQMKIICLRNKICPSITMGLSNGFGSKRVGRTKSIYNMGFWGIEGDKFAKFVNEPFIPEQERVGRNKSWVDEHYQYSLVRNIKSVEYSGKVYDLEIEGSHSFCGESLLLHNTVIEALSCGTPVLATRIGSMPEIITHGHNGYLIDMDGPAGDPQNIGAWQRAIGWIEEGLISSEDCRKDAVARFDRMVAAKRYIELRERLEAKRVALPRADLLEDRIL